MGTDMLNGLTFDVLLILPQKHPCLIDLLGFTNLQRFLQTSSQNFMTVIGLSFRFGYCHAMTRFGCLLKHLRICWIMSLNKYFVVLHEVLLINNHTLIVVYIHLIEHSMSRTSSTMNVRPTLPGSGWQNTSVRES